MNDATRRAVELSIGGTNQPVDNARNVLQIRAAASPADRAEVLRMIRARRADWLTWVTTTQRQWQAHTRRPSRARHPDSITIREKYVRA